MNRWIQGIMLFDFVLNMLPGHTHLAADALSRRSLGEGETVEEEDDEWLDNIALHITSPDIPWICLLQISYIRLPSIQSSRNTFILLSSHSALGQEF